MVLCLDIKMFSFFLIQKSMKAEMEMAMKLLEKDVHEKQDTIIHLRDQLEDIKSINLEMYTKLQVCCCPFAFSTLVLRFFTEFSCCSSNGICIPFQRKL